MTAVMTVVMLETGKMTGDTGSVDMNEMCPEKEMTGEMKDEMTGEMKEKMTGEMKEKMTGEMKEKMTGEMKDEMTGEMKDEMTGEMKDEMTGEMKDEMTEERREKMTGEMKHEMTGEMKDEMTGEMKDEMTEERREKMKDEMTGEMTEERREKMTGEMKDEMTGEMTGEMKDETTGEMKEEMTGDRRGWRGEMIGETNGKRRWEKERTEGRAEKEIHKGEAIRKRGHECHEKGNATTVVTETWIEGSSLGATKMVTEKINAMVTTIDTEFKRGRGSLKTCKSVSNLVVFVYIASVVFELLFLFWNHVTKYVSALTLFDIVFFDHESTYYLFKEKN